MPEYDSDNAQDVLERHVRAFFTGHTVTSERWPVGPIESRIPGFHVFAISPGPRLSAWTFITCGCWAATAERGHGLEFVLSAPSDDRRHVEVMTVMAYYHAGPRDQRLDIGHTVPIGEPWVPGSSCTHLLISLPYAYGPDLEVCAWRSGHARLLSAIPITEAERDLKGREGLEALETRLEARAADFTDPSRPSVA